MKRTSSIALVWASLCLAWASNARGQAAAGTSSDETITRDQAKSGVMTVSGKEYEVHPATPTYGGDTGLFDLPSAYTLPKGKLSFNVFRTNLTTGSGRSSVLWRRSAARDKVMQSAVVPPRHGRDTGADNPGSQRVPLTTRRSRL